MEQNERDAKVARYNASPFNAAHGFVASLPEDGFGIVEVELTEEHRNVWGIPHGGILFAMADSASGLAASSVCGGHIVTSGSSVNFIFASQSAQHLRAEARVIKAGHALAVVQTEVYDQDGNHLMTGQFNMFHG